MNSIRELNYFLKKKNYLFKGWNILRCLSTVQSFQMNIDLF